MSFFGGKTITSYDVVSSPLIKNEDLPNYATLLALQGKLHPAGHSYVYKDLLRTGPAAKARQLYNIALNDPLLGLPRSYDTFADTDLTSVLQPALEAKHVGDTVTIVDFYISSLFPVADEDAFVGNYAALFDSVYGGRSTTFTEYAINPEDNEVNVVKPLEFVDAGFPYTHYLIKTPPANTSYTVAGQTIPVTYYRKNGIYARTYVQGGQTYKSRSFAVDIVLLTPALETTYKNMTYAERLAAQRSGALSLRKHGITFKGNTGTYLNEEDMYAVVAYRLNGESHERMYAFNYTSPTDEELSLATSVAVNGLGYLPIVPLKENWVTVEDDPNTVDKSYGIINGRFPTKQAIYRSTDSILKRTSFKLDDLLNAISSTENGNDPSIMRNIYYGYFADVGTNQESTIKYLFTYFDYLKDKMRTTKAEYLVWKAELDYRLSTKLVGKVGSGDPSWAYWTAKYFGATKNHEYQHNFLVMEDVLLNEIQIQSKKFNVTLLCNYIDKVTITGSIGSVGACTKTIVEGTETEFVRARFDKYGNVTPGRKYVANEDNSVSSAYMVLRKQISDTAYEEITVHGLMHMYQPKWNRFVKRTLNDAAAATRDVNLDRSVYLPILYGELMKLPAVDILDVLGDTAGFVIYAQDSVKVKWYQDASFLRLVQVVIMVGFTLAGLPEVGAGIAGLLNFVINLIINILITYAASKVLEIILKELGIDNSFILLLAAIITVAITGDFTVLDLGYFSLDAMLLLNASMMALSEIYYDDLDDFNNEINKHEDLLNEYADALEEAEAFLEMGDKDINYLLLTKRPKYILDKTPEVFYKRTTELVDIPSTVYSVIDVYHDYNLRIDDDYL